jgi:hypothetical protein
MAAGIKKESIETVKGTSIKRTTIERRTPDETVETVTQTRVLLSKDQEEIIESYRRRLEPLATAAGGSLEYFDCFPIDESRLSSTPAKKTTTSPTKFSSPTGPVKPFHDMQMVPFACFKISGTSSKEPTGNFETKSNK